MTVGKVYSPDMLAYYDRAFSYSALVMQVIGTSLSSVLLPVFSRQQDDKVQLKMLARRTVGISSFVMIPVLSGVALVAEPLVCLLLTEKWIACAPFLSLFCVLRIPGIITSIDKQVYLSLGKSQIGLYYEIVLLGINLLSLFLMIPHGIFAVAIGYTMVEFLGNFILCIISCKVYGYSLKERMIDLAKPIISSLVMVISGYGLTYLVLSIWTLLICQIVVCIIVYFLMAFLLKDINLKFVIDKISIKC